MSAAARVISIAIAVVALLAVTPASGASQRPDDNLVVTALFGSTSIFGTSTRITWTSGTRDRPLVISWCSRTS